MSKLQTAREDLCMLMNQCYDCEYVKEHAVCKEFGGNTTIGSSRMCAGCDHLTRIKEQLAVVETLQRERKKAKGIKTEQDITWKKQGRKKR